jgi:hypothetical protein
MEDINNRLNLLPCPFCGSDACWDGDGYVSCSNMDCGLNSGICKSFKIEVWNKRHLLNQPNNWISVDDKMPEEKRWVLGLVETTGHIQPVILQVHLNENGIWKDLQGNIPDGSWEVIYWKPLPNPPKQQE